MRLVIMFTLLGTGPLFPILHALSVVSKLAVAGEVTNNLEQVDGGIVARCLRPWVTEETLVIKLFHMLHSLLG